MAQFDLNSSDGVQEVTPKNGEGHHRGWVSSNGFVVVQEPTRLFGGGFYNNTISTTSWDQIAANGGTFTCQGQVAKLFTNTTANGSSWLISTKPGRYINGYENWGQMFVRIGDTGVANCVRRWGVFDANNGVFFELDGTTMYVCHRNSGVDTRIPQSSWNGESAADFVLNNKFHYYDITYSSGHVHFGYSKKTMHILEIEDASPGSAVDEIHLKIGVMQFNKNGATGNHEMNVREISLSRLGKPISRPTWYATTSSSEAKTLKSSNGTLHRVLVNKRGSGSSVITLYDGKSAAGTKIASIDTTVSLGTIEYDLEFYSGLHIVTNNGTADITIIYD